MQDFIIRETGAKIKGRVVVRTNSLETAKRRAFKNMVRRDSQLAIYNTDGELLARRPSHGLWESIDALGVPDSGCCL